MGRRSSRNSVYNKRSNERVQSAQASGTSTATYVKANQAHAQSAQNPTQNRQAQPQQGSPQSTDPWARASQFASNVGRGASDTARSYTTDFYDMGEAALTGRQREEKSYQDETLAGVFGRGLFEGNLHGAVDEAGRRITQEPGRVVGEVAAEAAILGATMGFGAALKGARIGAAGVKAGSKHIASQSTKAVAKTKVSKGEVLGNRMVSGYTRNTSRLSPFNRGGKEFISSPIGYKPSGLKKGHTLTIKTNKQGKQTAKVTKDLSITGWTRGITARSAVMGNRFTQRIGKRTQHVIFPVVAGGSKPLNAADNLKPETIGVAVKQGKVVAKDTIDPFSGLTDDQKGFMKQSDQAQGVVNIGNDVDPSFMGSINNPQAYRASERVTKDSIFFGKRDGNVNNLNPDLGDTLMKGNKAQETVNNKTVDEWIKGTSDKIEGNKNIKGDSEIQRSMQEPGVQGQFSTDTVERTNPSSFIDDKSSAVRGAENIIRDGFNTGKDGPTIESALTDLFSRSGTPAKVVKTNVRRDGSYNPQNVGIGTEVGSFAATKNNKIKSILPSMVSDVIKEADGTLYPANLGQLEAVGKASSYGGRSAKTGMERYWEILKESGDSTSLEKGISGEDIIKPGTSTHKQDPTDFLVGTQHDFVRTNKQGNLIGNPQVGLSKEQNALKIESAMSNILGPIATKGPKAGERIENFGYAAFAKKYNAGKLKSQKNVVPTKKLPAKLSTFKSQRGLTDKMYNDLNFQQNKKSSVASALKKYVDGDVMEEEYTGEIAKDTLFTKQGFKDAGSVDQLYNSQELPYSNLGRELQITARTRTSTINKPIVKRSSTPYTPKTLIEKDESLVAFDINRIFSLGKPTTTKLAQKNSRLTRRLTGDNRGPKGQGKVTGVYGKNVKKKKPVKYNTFTSLFGKTTDNNSMATNIDTGMPDPMARNTPLRVPLWAQGGGDTTRIGGGKIYPPSGIRKLDGKPRKTVFPNPSSMMFGFLSKSKSESEMIAFSRKTKGWLGGGATRNDWFMQP